MGWGGGGSGGAELGSHDSYIQGAGEGAVISSGGGEGEGDVRAGRERGHSYRRGRGLLFVALGHRNTHTAIHSCTKPRQGLK